MAKKRVMITMEEELLQRLDVAAKAQGVSKSAYISSLVARDLNDTEKFLNEFRTLLDQAMKESALTS